MVLPSFSLWGLLLLLQALLLLGVFLFQLLSLLLVFLLQLLGPGRIRVLGYTLMFLLLLLLEFLMFLILLLRQLCLLLLIFLIACSISRARRSGWLVRLQIFGMSCIRWLRNIVFRPARVFRTSFISRTRRAFRPTGGFIASRRRPAAFGWRMVWRSGFFSWHCRLEVCRSSRRCYRRSALIN